HFYPVLTRICRAFPPLISIIWILKIICNHPSGLIAVSNHAPGFSVICRTQELSCRTCTYTYQYNTPGRMQCTGKSRSPAEAQFLLINRIPPEVPASGMGRQHSPVCSELPEPVGIHGVKHLFRPVMRGAVVTII